MHLNTCSRKRSKPQQFLRNARNAVSNNEMICNEVWFGASREGRASHIYVIFASAFHELIGKFEILRKRHCMLVCRTYMSSYDEF